MHGYHPKRRMDSSKHPYIINYGLRSWAQPLPGDTPTRNYDQSLYDTINHVRFIKMSWNPTGTSHRLPSSFMRFTFPSCQLQSIYLMYTRKELVLPIKWWPIPMVTKPMGYRHYQCSMGHLLTSANPITIHLSEKPLQRSNRPKSGVCISQPMGWQHM